MQVEQSASPSPQSASKRRAAYALAAGAAAGAVGVGVNEADAAIKYSGIYNISITPGFFQPLDLDDAGATPDINLSNTANAFGTGFNYQSAFVPNIGGRLVGFNSGFNYVTALTAGSMIDVTTVSPTIFSGSMAFGPQNPNAQFNTASDAFIGLYFPDGPNFHYGWIRVGVNNAAGTFLIKDWAYEDQPGVGIRAGQIPEPGALGLLACGALGVAALRRRRAAA